MKIKSFLVALFAITSFFVFGQEPSEIVFEKDSAVVLSQEDLGFLTYEINDDSSAVVVTLESGFEFTLKGEFSEGGEFSGIVSDVKKLIDGGKGIIDSVKEGDPQSSTDWIIAIAKALAETALAGGFAMYAPIIARTWKTVRERFSNIKDNRNLVYIFSGVAGFVWALVDLGIDGFTIEGVSGRMFAAFIAATFLYNTFFNRLETPKIDDLPQPIAA